MQGDKYSIDMCSGPIFSKIILFSVPLILSGILQLMFNAADLIVLGRFASPEAMAAVGATAFLTNLIVNVFIGLSIGTNVLAANYLGAKNWKNTSRTVHTAIAVSLAGGAALAIIGIPISKPLLEMMSTPDDIIGMAALYMWIYSRESQLQPRFRRRFRRFWCSATSSVCATPAASAGRICT